MAKNCDLKFAEAKLVAQTKFSKAQVEPQDFQFSGHPRGGFSLLALAIAFALALSGCAPVQSLYPFCDPKDAIFDAGMVGAWAIKEDDGLTMRILFEKDSHNPNNYKADVLFRADKPEEGKPDEGTISFRVQLFQVGQSRFADFYPLNYSAKSGPWSLALDSRDNMFGIPTHTVYKVKMEKDHLVLAYLDDDFVKRFEAKSRLSLSAPDLEHYLLTAGTESLKKNLLMNTDKEDLVDNEGINFVRQP
jgi:hypothetical protein